MVKEIKAEKAVNEDCKYSYVMAVSKRAKELRRLVREKNVPLDEIATIKTAHTKPLSVALEEFNSGNIKMKYKTLVEKSEKKDKPESPDTKLEDATEPSSQKEPEVPAETT
jgi:DNA-directed RNA polymerase subunit K/omega